MKRIVLYLTCLVAAFFSACSNLDNSGPETVCISEVTNLTPTFIGSISGIKEGDAVEKGGTIELLLTPGEVLSSGFKAVHMEHIHVHVGDRVFMPTFPEGSEEAVSSLSIEVPAPEASAGIVVAYSVQQKLDPEGFTMELESNDDGIVLYGVMPDAKYKYFDCYLRTPDAYTIETVEFKMGDGEWTDIESVPGCGCERTESLDWVYNVCVRPDYQNVSGDIVVRVKGSQHARFDISWKNTEFIRTDIPEDYEPNVLPEEAIDGERVVASFWTKEGYYLAGASSNVEGLELECVARSYVVFTMPASDVEIDLDFRQMIPVKYESGEHVTDAMIYDAKDIYYGVPTDLAIPGEQVYLFVNVEAGYKPSVARNDKGEAFPFVLYGGGMDRYAWYAPVGIPEDAVSASITAEVAVAHTVSGDESIFFNGGTQWVEGETVTFMVAVPEGKTLKGVTVETAGGDAVAYELDNTYGSFVMPACDVRVGAVFEDMEQGTTAHISAVYDAEQYSVYSQTSPYWQEIDGEGFDVPAGTTLYINVSDYYGMPFWVGVKIGDSASTYEAQADPDSGETYFGKSFVISADTEIKVGGSEGSVKF